eukprot:gene15743-biopygen8191
MVCVTLRSFCGQRLPFAVKIYTAWLLWPTHAYCGQQWDECGSCRDPALRTLVCSALQQARLGNLRRYMSFGK